MKNILEHDVSTDTITFRDYTPEEALERNNTKIKYDAEQALIVNDENKKSAARKLILEKLGITEDEARLLLS